MKFTIQSAVGAALLSVASVSAFATSVTPPSNGPAPVNGATTNGNGALLVTVYDLTTGHSLTEWLGPSFLTLGTASAQPTETLDYGNVDGTSAAFSALFSASEIAAGNVLFEVSAGSLAAGSAQAKVATTFSSIGSFSVFRNVALTSINQGITGGITTFNAVSGNPNPISALNGTSDPNWTGTSLGNNFSATLASGFNTAGTVGSSLAFYLLGQSSTSNTGLVNHTQFAGTGGAATWTLSTSGDLVYTVPGTSAVPLPAAVWLFGSGLLGLAGIGRRKLAA